MDLVYVSFSLNTFSCDDFESFEKTYADVLKPLIKFLNKNPLFNFSFSFKGPELNFIKKKKSEFLKVLSELVKRNQCEIYGGAFYNPVLPLILPSDRTSQIEMLSSELRHATGKAPRGLNLYNDVWDSSLIQTMKSASMDYVLLDELTIPADKRKFLPVNMNDLGKSKDIYYISRSLKEDFFNLDIESFFKKIQKQVIKANSISKLVVPVHKNIVNISFSASEIKQAFEKGLFQNLIDFIKEQGEESPFRLTTILSYSKVNSQKVTAYIPNGISPVIAQISDKPYSRTENLENKTIYDFLQCYPRKAALYYRMLYVSQIVYNPGERKTFQNAAREKLWEGLCGDGLLNLYLTTKETQVYYKKLMEAINILRNNGIMESIISYDYDNDGYPEYVIRMDDYFSYISLKAGAVHDFQPYKKTANYADNYSREEAFDGFSDGYERGFFIDHLFTPDQFDKYIHKETAGDGVFSKVLYEEVKFSPKHHEILLKASASVKGQQISITKKYLVNSSGMNIQYIIKNESDKQFSSKFCVESNFAHIDFDKENHGDYKVLLATETEGREVDSEKASVECFEKGYLENINVVQITDQANGISFSFEPNENCSYCFYPLKFSRPNWQTGEMIDLAMTYVSTLFWDLDIEPGKEIEKNFNFTVFNSHKVIKKSLSK